MMDTCCKIPVEVRTCSSKNVIHLMTAPVFDVLYNSASVSAWQTVSKDFRLYMFGKPLLAAHKIF